MKNGGAKGSAIVDGKEGTGIAVFLKRFSSSSSDDEARGEGSWVGGVFLSVVTSALIFRLERLLCVGGGGDSLFELCNCMGCDVEAIGSLFGSAFGAASSLLDGPSRRARFGDVEASPPPGGDGT